MKTAFVTGGTGLLGNNLVRELAAVGVRVKALVRSRKKGGQQLGDVDGVELVVGDLGDVSSFAAALGGSDVLFHTAAFFRDTYKGGEHAAELDRINVQGTEALLKAAYAAGIRRMVHTSSVAVLAGEKGQLIDETMSRDESDADDYYRSKILTDRVVRGFLDTHPDFNAVFVLPAWMWGPGDAGPTSSGQIALDTINGELPGVAATSFSLVDARDVAKAQIAAAERGRRGERYLAAGRSVTLREAAALVAKVSGVPAPSLTIPYPVLYAVAAMQELTARFTGQPLLITRASVAIMQQEAGRSTYDHSKSMRELGVSFRPAEETVRDTVAWYRANGFIKPKGTRRMSAAVAGAAPAPGR